MNINTVLKIIILETIVGSLMSLIIIGTVAFIIIFRPNQEMPSFFITWGGIVLGFYFGIFTGFVKDVILAFANNNQTEKGNT